jgi:hypothetical protein
MRGVRLVPLALVALAACAPKAIPEGPGIPARPTLSYVCTEGPASGPAPVVGRHRWSWVANASGTYELRAPSLVERTTVAAGAVGFKAGFETVEVYQLLPSGDVYRGTFPVPAVLVIC